MHNGLGVQGGEDRLTFASWLLYMIGQRDAVLKAAGARNALWIGLLFVLAAGFPREYDGEYLLREPWHLLLPLAASLATSLLLYVLVYLIALRQGIETLQWWPGYRTLLTFYWLTGPLAWLYAVPVEHYLSPVDAVRANLTLLAVVSVWRVLLITRAISVWLDASFFKVLWVVLFFGDSVLLIANFVMPMPVWDIMGGVRLPERESLILNLRLATTFYGIIAWVVIGVGLLIYFAKPKLTVDESEARSVPSAVGASLWAFAVVLLIGGLTLLPYGQPAQAHRWHAEQLLRGGQVAEGIRYMVEVPRGEFPPHWDPPPRIGYGEDVPDVFSVLSEIERIEHPEWLQDQYVEKLMTYGGIERAIESAENGDPKTLNQILDFVEKDSFARLGDSLHWQLVGATDNEKLEPSLRSRIRNLVRVDEARTPTAD